MILLRPFAAVLCLLAGLGAAHAETWPVRPVKIVTAFTPGGLADIVARLMATHYETAFGKPFVVENRPGAGGIVGTDYVAKAAADGYTLLFTTSAVHASGPNLYPSLPYDPVAGFTHISRLGTGPIFLFVNATAPYATLAKFVRAAKAAPGTFDFGSPGPGSLGHLTGELIKLAAGIEMTHIPYKGALPAQTDLLGGRLHAMTDNLPAQRGMIEAGRLRALGLTAEQRLPLLPDVPTFAEQGYPGVVALAWVGLCAPAGLPPELTARLNAETRRILQEPSVRDRLTEFGLSADGTLSSTEQTAFVRSEIARWGEVVRAGGVKLE